MHEKNCVRWIPFVALCALITLAALPAMAASPGAADSSSPSVLCGPEQRAAFADAANNGVPASVLVQQYAHCMQAAPANLDLQGDEKVITINNALASTFYEQMNGCGYHPQFGVAACDVEIKQPFGFGPFGPAPLGSTEYVDFCFFCGGGVFNVQGTVHVTDDTTGVAPSWGMAAFAQIPQACGFPAGTGAPFQVRATLSWGVPAINPCSNAPTMVWGNQINFDTRDDP